MYDKNKCEAIIQEAMGQINDLDILDGYKASIGYYLIRVNDVCCIKGSGSLWDLENQLSQLVGTMDYEPKDSPWRIIAPMFRELKKCRISET